MLLAQCSECDQLWRALGDIAQRHFRWEERLRRAEGRQDLELARALVARLADLARERARMNKALAEHEAREHTKRTFRAAPIEPGCAPLRRASRSGRPFV